MRLKYLKTMYSLLSKTLLTHDFSCHSCIINCQHYYNKWFTGSYWFYGPILVTCNYRAGKLNVLILAVKYFYGPYSMYPIDTLVQLRGSGFDTILFGTVSAQTIYQTTYPHKYCLALCVIVSQLNIFILICSLM